jgi:hypothetical protein
LGTKLPTRKYQHEWNSKCLHRVDAVEQIFVHWPETYREDYQPEYTQYLKEQHGIPQILHARHDKVSRTPYNTPFDATEEHEDWVDSLWRERDALAEVITNHQDTK